MARTVISPVLVLNRRPDTDDVTEVELLEISIVFALGQFVAGDVALDRSLAVRILMKLALPMHGRR